MAGFMRRHPDLSKRTPTRTTGGRLSTFNRITVTKWYGVTKPIAVQYTAEETWNCDDCGCDVENSGWRKVRPHNSAHVPTARCMYLHHVTTLSSRLVADYRPARRIQRAN